MDILEDLKRKNLAHNDIKPENVIWSFPDKAACRCNPPVASHGQVYLIDLESVTPLGRPVSSEVATTLAYRDPTATLFDSASDQFSTVLTLITFLLNKGSPGGLDFFLTSPTKRKLSLGPDPLDKLFSLRNPTADNLFGKYLAERETRPTALERLSAAHHELLRALIEDTSRKRKRNKQP